MAMERGDYLAAKRRAPAPATSARPPAADVLGRAIYHTFRAGLAPRRGAVTRPPTATARAPPKPLALRAVLPLTQVPEAAVATRSAPSSG